MAKLKCYVVLYLSRGEMRTRTCPDGPWDYYGNALACRNKFFADSPDVTSCWIQETTGKSRGKVLKRP
jgi:hypothetical protein